MAFELMDSFLTGIGHLDDQHRELIARVNTVADLEQAGSTAGLLNALTEFRTDLAQHFSSEEAHLRKVSYPKLGSHAKHHAETIAVLDRLIGDIEVGEPVERIAATCYHELISAVILEDMQFLNWLADHPDVEQ